ncbi:MAG TPA: 2,3-diphosphoglycerate-dependent phosphoglycerate mutase [Acidimicrobiales bacterium]|nr:2,3-diphosphoglycerate-dependent phosphoglycerate mutase [Acidimicrobiales bacterium]
MPTLVLLRHGQSQWNEKDLFTGWIDVDLTAKGEDEARAGGRALVAAGVLPTIVHTSLLTRAIRTADLALEEVGRLWLPVRRTWRLNERHYGDLQGRNKAETRERYGDEQFTAWRRSYATAPPPLPEGDERSARSDPRYADLPPEVVPATECLADVVVRLRPWWEDAIGPDLKGGHVVLVVAHGNSLRALRKHLDQISDADIVGLELPTGVPTVYELDAALRPLSRRDLGPDASAAGS